MSEQAGGSAIPMEYPPPPLPDPAHYMPYAAAI